MAVSVDRSDPATNTVTTDVYASANGWTANGGSLLVSDVNGGRLAEYPAGQWIRAYQTG